MQSSSCCISQTCTSIARTTHRARISGKVILAQLVPVLNLLLWFLGEPVEGNCAPATQQLMLNNGRDEQVRGACARAAAADARKILMSVCQASSQGGKP